MLSPRLVIVYLTEIPKILIYEDQKSSVWYREHIKAQKNERFGLHLTVKQHSHL